MTETKKFKVSILGETIGLNSDESVDHMNSVSAYLDGLLKKISKTGLSPNMTNAEKLLFASVLLADDLLKTRQENTVLARRLKEAEIDRLTAKKELEDFMFVMDKKNFAAGTVSGGDGK